MLLGVAINLVTADVWLPRVRGVNHQANAMLSLSGPMCRYVKKVDVFSAILKQTEIEAD